MFGMFSANLPEHPERPGPGQLLITPRRQGAAIDLDWCLTPVVGIVEEIVDPVGTFYRFGLAASLLRRKKM